VPAHRNHRPAPECVELAITLLIFSGKRRLCAVASVAVGRHLRVAYRPPGRHQTVDELGSLGLIERGVRHAPQPAADDEVAPVRRLMVLHDAL
jgi:hypothetical protein